MGIRVNKCRCHETISECIQIFPTKAGEWTEVTVPFETLVPSHHGRQITGPPLDLSKVEESGLLFGDGRAEDFVLAVEWMKAQ